MRNRINALILILTLSALCNSFADSSIDEITSLLKITPKDSELYFQRGYLFYGQENYEKASDDFTTSIRLQPEEMLYHFYKAMTDLKSGKNRSSIEGFKTVLKIKPDYAEALFYLGILYHKVNDTIRAGEAFDKIILLNNNVAKYWAARARFQKEMGNLEESVSNYNKALEIDDNFAIVHYELAWINYEARNIDTALVHARKIINLERSPVYYHTLACIYSEKDISKAIENELKALDLEKNSVYESKLAGFKNGKTYSEQESSELKLQEEIERKKEIERIRREKIWENIVDKNKSLNASN